MNCVKRLLPVLLVATAVAACAPPAAKKGASSPSASRTQPRTTADRSRAAPGAKAPAKPGAAKPASVTAVADVKTRYKAALEQIRQGQLKDAEETLEQIVKEAPDLSGPKTNLGIIYAKTNRRDDAVSAFNKAVVANPGNAVAHNWLGTL